MSGKAVGGKLTNATLAASQIIRHLSRLVPGKMDRDALFNILARQLQLFFSYDRLCINVYDAEREFLNLFTAPDGTVVESLASGRRAENTVADMVVKTLKPVVINDLSGHDFGGRPHPLSVVGLNATIALPLIINREVIGTLHASFVKQPDNFIEILNLLLDIAPVLSAFLFSILSRERLKHATSPAALPAVGPDIEAGLFETPDMAAVMSLAHKIAPLNIPVLLTGETGTGKSMLARYLHAKSQRHAANFIKVNCPSLAPTLFESEMFGHAKGAYTGASTKRIGRFEMAQEGTLFLDEIAELSPEMQSKLLQVMEENAFERVGETNRLNVDVRVISATNVNIPEALAERRLRRDLYYRLSAVTLRLPPLRERRNDIPRFLNYFLNAFARQYGLTPPTLPQSSLAELCAYPWPGNIRELRNVVHRILLRAMDGRLTTASIHDISEACGEEPPSEPSPPPAQLQAPDPAVFPTLEENEREHIRRALALSGGKLSGPNGAATLLGIPRSTLQHHLRKLGLRARSEVRIQS